MAYEYDSDVLIVGGGIGGLTLACRLAPQGYRMRILQPDVRLQHDHRPEMLQPGALQALAELGVLEKLRAKGVPQVQVFHFYRIGGEELCQIDYRVLDHTYPYTLTALPYQTRRVLLENLGLYPNVHLHWDTRFVGILRQGTQVVGVKALEEGLEREFWAKVTIGADGSGSQFRTALGIASQIKRYSNAYVGMLLKLPEGIGEDFTSEVHYYLGQGEILGCFPCSHRRLCLLFLMPTGRLRAVCREDLSQLKDRIRDIDWKLADPLTHLTAWEQVSSLFPVQVHAAQWVTDGAALLGDAAHALHPHLAQGSFQAMEDSKLLAKLLEACFQHGDFSARALAPYEAARRPVVERLQRLADEYVWLWETNNPLIAHLRDRIFRNVGRNRRLLKKVAAVEAGLEPRGLAFSDHLQALGLS